MQRLRPQTKPCFEKDNIKRTQTYVILGMALLLSISLFLSSGWAAETEIISFLPRDDEDLSIYLVNTQGKLLQRLMVGPESIGAFSWSPDGGSIVYGSNRNGAPDIYVMDVRTVTHRRLTFLEGSRDIWPAWSPNGKWIAFISERNGGMDIYRMDVSGENVMRLTNRGGCKRPAWSPDSQSIAFSGKRKDAEIGSFIYLMSAEGRGLRRLTDTSTRVCTWAPNGKEIAFVPPGDAVGGTALFSIDIDGKNMRQLTRLYKGLVTISDATWSPSGKCVAYVLVQLPEIRPGIRIPAEDIFANSVISVVNTADIGGDEPLEATRKLVGSDIQWVPDGFLSVSPSAEKQTTLWGKLKQPESTTK